MAGRKSSFLLRARRIEAGERIEISHLESQATGRFQSLDEAVAWVRARWSEWDASPADTEDAPATPAERKDAMNALWESGTAWTGRGLRRGEAIALALAILIVAIGVGDPGTRATLGRALSSTQLAASGAVLKYVTLSLTGQWTLTSGNKAGTYQTNDVKFIDDPNSGANGVGSARYSQGLLIPGTALTTRTFEGYVVVCFAPQVKPSGDSRGSVVVYTSDLEITAKVLTGLEVFANLCTSAIDASGATPVLGVYFYGPGVTGPARNKTEFKVRFDWLSIS